MIVVTGATGNIGSEVVRLLAKSSAPMRLFARDPDKARRLFAASDPALAGKLEIALGDLLDAPSIEPALAGATKLFLVAGAKELPQIARDVSAIAKRAGVRQIVLVSSATIAIEPSVRIGRWHAEAEAHVRDSGVGFTFLRPGNFASNTLRWADMIRSQGTVFGPFAQTRSAVIDPRDIAAVAARALVEDGHEGKTYTLTGPDEITAPDQVRIIGEAIGKPLRFVEVPEAGARQAMLRSGLDELWADVILELQRAVQRGEGGVTRTVEEVTGRPARPFAAWARDHAAAFA